MGDRKLRHLQIFGECGGLEREILQLFARRKTGVGRLFDGVMEVLSRRERSKEQEHGRGDDTSHGISSF
jgi:hypothetical protein